MWWFLKHCSTSLYIAHNLKPRFLWYKNGHGRLSHNIDLCLFPTLSLVDKFIVFTLSVIILYSVAGGHTNKQCDKCVKKIKNNSLDLSRQYRIQHLKVRVNYSNCVRTLSLMVCLCTFIEWSCMVVKFSWTFLLHALSLLCKQYSW